ncbi:MAG TPA: chorismate mutase [Negativicutes bacterium]|nr:chorismate mutase [Negativicutes bacterium]
MLRGVRGATTVEANDKEQISCRTAELITAMAAENGIVSDDIGAVIFSSTPDLDAAFPAAAARVMGWSEVPLFGTQEIANPDAVARCIRILILWNTAKGQKEIRHVYLHGATVLRQDLARHPNT